MKKFFFSLLMFVSIVQNTSAQKSCLDMLKEAEAFAASGKYREAILKYNAAKSCDQLLGSKVDERILEVFDKIERLKKKSEKQAQIINQNLVETSKENENLKLMVDILQLRRKDAKVSTKLSFELLKKTDNPTLIDIVKKIVIGNFKAPNYLQNWSSYELPSLLDTIKNTIIGSAVAKGENKILLVMEYLSDIKFYFLNFKNGTVLVKAIPDTAINLWRRSSSFRESAFVDAFRKGEFSESEKIFAFPSGNKQSIILFDEDGNYLGNKLCHNPTAIKFINNGSNFVAIRSDSIELYNVHKDSFLLQSTIAIKRKPDSIETKDSLTLPPFVYIDNKNHLLYRISSKNQEILQTVDSLYEDIKLSSISPDGYTFAGVTSDDDIYVVDLLTGKFELIQMNNLMFDEFDHFVLASSSKAILVSKEAFTVFDLRQGVSQVRINSSLASIFDTDPLAATDMIGFVKIIESVDGNENFFLFSQGPQTPLSILNTSIQPYYEVNGIDSTLFPDSISLKINKHEVSIININTLYRSYGKDKNPNFYLEIDTSFPYRSICLKEDGKKAQVFFHLAERIMGGWDPDDDNTLSFYKYLITPDKRFVIILYSENDKTRCRVYPTFYGIDYLVNELNILEL